MKYQFLAVASFVVSFVSPSAEAFVSPSSTKIKVYKFAVSTSEYCTNPTTVFTSADGVESDFVSNPTIGSGTIAAGTYKCIILEISDTIKVTPAATEGHCVVGVESSKGVCGAGTVVQLIDGTTTTCTAGEDRMTTYISTASENDGTQAWWISSGCSAAPNNCNGNVPPTASNTKQGTKLNSALVVTGNSSGSFVADLTNGLDGTGSQCSLEQMYFGFK